MHTAYWPDTQSFPLKPSVCSLGVFDGVHVGHQEVLRVLREKAADSGLPAVVVTFDLHPSVHTADSPPPLLTTLQDKLSLIEAQGVDGCLVIHFTREVASTPARVFVEEVLCDLLAARAVIVGFNTRFGRGREGTPELLSQWGNEIGFETVICDPVKVGDEVVSSTRIRNVLQAGQVEIARELLGRPYSLRGRVVHGDARGRRLGYPTANIDAADQLIPAEGVYATVARVEGRDYASVTSISSRVTFYSESDAPVVVETHLMDFGGDLYEQTCSLRFAHRLREQRRFPDQETLKAQIGEDVARARELLRGEIKHGR